MIDPRQLAQQRFEREPNKCFQRHIREVFGEIESGPELSLDGARVVRITREQAASIIIKYEYLGTLGNAALKDFFGLWCGDVLAGACVFGQAGTPEPHYLCGVEHAALTTCLHRGSCIPNTPKNAASWFIRRAVKMVSKECGWKVFFAYSDPAAGEIGTIYQALNWKYLGALNNPKTAWVEPDGTKHASTSMKRKGLTRRQCFALGWKPVVEHPKGKYVWFEDYDFEKLCRFEFLPYPKRKVQQ